MQPMFMSTPTRGQQPHNIFYDDGLAASSASPQQLHPRSSGGGGGRASWALRDFDVGRKLGEGRFGKIYLAREKATKYAVVLKCIAKEAVLQYDLHHQIRREVELHMFAKHRHVIRMLAYFWDHDSIYLVLEHADGGDLQSLVLREYGHCQRRMPEAVAATVVAQLCSALKYLHAHKILHRDVKPENLLLKKGAVKLADFTWAVLCHDRNPHTQNPSRRSTVCGTLDYMSPELVSGGEYAAGVDCWAVGAMTFELLTGQAPFFEATEVDTCKRIRQGKLLLTAELRPLLSDLALDFIGRLLVVEEPRRMTMADALFHPWLADARAVELRGRSQSGPRSTSRPRGSGLYDGTDGSSAAAAAPLLFRSEFDPLVKSASGMLSAGRAQSGSAAHTFGSAVPGGAADGVGGGLQAGQQQQQQQQQAGMPAAAAGVSSRSFSAGVSTLSGVSTSTIVLASNSSILSKSSRPATAPPLNEQLPQPQHPTGRVASLDPPPQWGSRVSAVERALDMTDSDAAGEASLGSPSAVGGSALGGSARAGESRSGGGFQLDPAEFGPRATSEILRVRPSGGQDAGPGAGSDGRRTPTPPALDGTQPKDGSAMVSMDWRDASLEMTAISVSNNVSAAEGF